VKGTSSVYGEGNPKAADYRSGSVIADWRWGSYRRMWQLQGNVELPGGGEDSNPSRVAESVCLNATTILSIRDDVSWYRHSFVNTLVFSLIFWW
jgi:hypothetical protein